MPRKTPQHHSHGEEVRLQAFLAHSGVASRRHAEELIASGRVFVNGQSVTAPGTKVRPGVDEIAVDGETVAVQPITWIALHKPKGYVTSRDDPYGRKTVYELLPEKYRGLFHVGRLDRDSEGILLLTNDGVLANRMLHPSFGVTKEYWSDVEGKPTAEQMHRIVEEGVDEGGDVLRAESIRRLHQTGENEHRLSVVLREGKNREVRRMMEALGHPVHRLIRRRFGPVSLGELKSGKWRVVTEAELASLRKGKGTGDRGQGTAGVARGDAVGGERPPRRKPVERAAEDAAPRRAAGERRPSRGAKPGERPGRPAKPGAKPHRPSERTPAARNASKDDEKPRRGSQQRGPDRRPWEAPAPARRPKPGEKPRDRRERDEEEAPQRTSAGRGDSARRGAQENRPTSRFAHAEDAPKRGPARGRGAPSRDEQPRGRREGDDESPRGRTGGRGSERAAGPGRGAKPQKPRGRTEPGAEEAAPRGPSYGRRGTFDDRVRAGRDRDEEESRRPKRPGGSRPAGARGGAAKGESPARRGGKPGGGRPPRGASFRGDDEGGGRGPRKGGGPRGRR